MQKTSGSKGNRPAFTLIELLIVVSIIGILASVTLISIFSARDRARNNRALSTMKSALLVAQSCVANGKSLSNPGSNAPNPGTYVCAGGPETWPDLTGTGFNYYYAGGSNYNNGMAYFAAYASDGSKKYIFCGQNSLIGYWWQIVGNGYWNFSGTSGCKAYGF